MFSISINPAAKANVIISNKRTEEGESVMKKILRTAVYSLVAAALLLPRTAGIAADVCSQGTGIPPFLSSGARPNLLMVLDNSGSMLDAAYSDETSYCFDDTYDKNKTYGGYFEQDRWYKWSQGDFAPWKIGEQYAEGQRVYVNGIIWKVEKDGGGISNGESLATDTGVAWERLFSLNKWANNTDYPSGSFVWSGPQLYYSENGGTSNDPNISNGLNLADDTGVTDWVPVDSTWLNGHAYTSGDIVTYKGILYEAASTATSSGTGIYDDKGVSWNRLDEGSFVVETDATNACSGAEYTHSDLCITLDTSVEPNQVPFFAARGNFLNWTMSSKFDVEKKILTGGKYNYYDDFLISENRGCSGSSTVKQIQMDGDGTNPGKFLSLGVRGSRHQDDPFHEDRIDSSDDVARLEVLALTDGGYELSEKCQTAITCIVDSGLNGCQQKIKDCLNDFPNSSSIMEDMRPALNNSLQACWQSDINDGIFSQLVSDCFTLYTGEKQPGSNFTPSRSYHPSELRPADGGPYLCYGIYDAEVDHLNRAGYMGRVWNAGGTGGTTTCDPMQATDQCSSAPCYWKYNADAEEVDDPDEENFKNETDGYVYKCTSVKNNGGCFSNAWELYHIASDGTGECDPDNPMFGSSGDGDWEEPTWADDKDVPAVPGNGILEAIKDYCDVMKVPEVIDPSGSAGKTGETGNAPALLRDSHLMAFLGGKDPLATMRGYISEDTRPEGIMQSVAGDLRLGLMVFNSVGAATECTLAATDTTSKIDKYCPLNNKDGASLLSEIEAGDLKLADDESYPSGKKRHVDDLADKINDTRATSWTPLGEAVYSALGYYTQNSKFCLNVDDNGKCLDWCLKVDADGNCTEAADDDPVEYWCQDNHILLITEGESTADINESVGEFSTNPSDYFVTKTADDTEIEGDGDRDDVGSTDSGKCYDGLFGGTYLDDMTWWGYRALPLYKERYLYDPDGNQNEKNIIYSHIVVTGVLTDDTTSECRPNKLMQDAAVNGGTEKYYSGEDPQQLEDNLYAVLGDIMNRASAGAAASVISNSRSGDGAIYQALFWPMKANGIDDENGNEGNIRWVGNVHALFIDSENIIYEDSNQNGRLDSDTDKKINIYFSNTVSRARGCYADLNADNQCPTDPVEDCDGDECVELEDIKYLWSANEQLRQLDDVLNDRKIFTWNDFNNDGIVNDIEDSSLNSTGETFLLEQRTEWTGLISDEDLKSAQRGPVVNDFLTPYDYSYFAGSSTTQATDAMNALVTWLSGKDVLDYETTTDDNNNTWLDRPLRSRHYNFVIKNDDGTTTDNQMEWRLGDVIHSSPITVNKPAENFHLIYRDPTYKDFVKKWSGRRTVVYFGANDGMLHAVNSGFYDDEDRQFYCSDGNQPDKSVCANDYNLGQELWAYVPYNLQPHLKCLADRFYEHKYFVDLEPRIADVQIFPVDDDHPGGWGTILVGGMRFGGAPIAAEDLNNLDGSGEDEIHDLREFSSSYFVLDITNPEKPKVLGELTRTRDDSCAEDAACVDLNYTTSSPGIIVMRQDDGSTKWYLVLGNGPAEQDGTNTVGKQGKVAILPLDRLIEKKAVRIPDQLPAATSEIGAFPVPFPDGDETSASYISHFISMDYNVELTAQDDLGARYRTDAVYFGTVDGTDFGQYSDEAVKSMYPAIDDITSLGDQWYWNGGGRVYRLVTRKTDINGDETASSPSQWTARPNDAPLDDTNSEWPIRMLMDVKGPVTAGPAAGYDETGENFWIYVGTGRFYDENDKTDDGRCLNADCTSRTQRAFFALKEPIKDGRDLLESPDVCSDTVMTWETIDWNIADWGTTDDGKSESNSKTALDPGENPGQRGLMRSDNILVGADTGYLSCGHLVTQDEDTYKKSWWATDPDDFNNTICFPGGKNGPIYDETLEQYTFEKLQKYITGTGCRKSTDSGDNRLYASGLDGWYHVFHDPRERNLNSSLLFNKKLFFSTYQPYNDKCKAEGQSFLYKLSHTTGTGAWNLLIDPSDSSTADKGSGESSFGEKGAGFGGGSSSGSSEENPGELHEFKQPVRGLANVGSAGAAGSGGEFYATPPPEEKRESNKLNWSDRCGQ